MRVMFLTPRLPYPPNRGGEITVYNFLRVLSRVHELSLVSFYDDAHELSYRSELERFCRDVEMVRRPGKFALRVLVRTGCGRRSYAVERHASPAFAAAVRRSVARLPPDVVQVETFMMGQYLNETSGVASVLDMHNVTWRVWDRQADVTSWWLRPAVRLQAARMRRDEIEVCRAVDVVAPVSDADRAELHAVAGDGIRCTVVRPGVDCELLTPPARVERGPEVLFVGSMSYVPNIDAVEFFCAEILPRVAAVVPDVRLTIVGANPPPAVQRLAGPRVTVTGFVPDVRPYYAGALAVVVPLRVGGGIRMKILEGMALGAAMVSTTIGAEGLGLADGRDLLMADTADAFAEAVVRLIRDPALRAALGVQGRQTAVERFSWDAAGRTLTGIYESLRRSPLV